MASLTLGSFAMIEPTGTAQVMAEGTNWGAPSPIEATVNSWLQDGAIVITQGHGNREFPVRVRLYGTDLYALNAKEAALFAELEKPNLLTWVPDAGPTSVFVVVNSSLVQDDDTLVGDLQAKPWRTYVVQIKAESFVRSATETVTAALPASGATTTVLDTMGATTGWTGFVNGGSVTVTNTVGPPTTNSVSSPSGSGTYLLAMQKTFAATTTATKLLMIDWKAPLGATGVSLVVTGDGVSLPLVAEQASPTSGYVRSFYNVAASSLAVVRIEYTSGPTAGAFVRTLLLDNISVTNDSAVFGSGRQQMRSFSVGGSARAPGTLKIESASAALGNGTLAYTFPTVAGNGYTPALRAFRTSGNTVTTDATMVSGSREPATSLGITFTIPYNLLPPGSYVLLARMGLPTGSETGTIVTTSTTKIGSTSLGSTAVNSTVSLTTTYQTFALNRLILPTVDVPASTTVSSITVNVNSTGWSGTPTLDEAWLFNTTIGQLIWVDCGTGSGAVGGASRRLFVSPPNTTTPRPTLRVGHSADGSDSYYPVGSVKSWQTPMFPTPQVNVWFVTPNVTDAVATLSAYWRWHTNPAA